MASLETKPSIELPSETPARAGDLTRERLEATQKWLRQVPDDRQAIQLVTVDARDLRKLEGFLLRASNVVRRDELFVYRVKFDGQEHYRVAYGDFPDMRQALAAIRKLPPPLQAQGPYVRSFGRMRSQDRQ